MASRGDVQRNLVTVTEREMEGGDHFEVTVSYEDPGELLLGLHAIVSMIARRAPEGDLGRRCATFARQLETDEELSGIQRDRGEVRRG